MVINQVECVGRFSPAAQLALLALLRRSDQSGVMRPSRLFNCDYLFICALPPVYTSYATSPTANLRHQLRNAPTGNWRHRRKNTPTRNSRHRLSRNWIRRGPNHNIGGGMPRLRTGDVGRGIYKTE
ncbi:hypothetical protein V8E54_005678 [Elaphomyces granulatus]